MFRRCVFAGLALAVGSLCAQTRLEFKNGDKLTGELKSVDEEAKTVTFYVTALKTTITVKQADVKVVNLPEVPSEALAGLPPMRRDVETTLEKRAAAKKEEETPKIVMPESKPAQIATSPLAPASPPKPAEQPKPVVPAPKQVAAKPPEKPVKASVPKPNPWKGKIEIGFNHYNGRRDLSSVYLRTDLEKKITNLHHKIYGRYMYSKQDGVLNSDRLDLSYRYRYDIGGGKKFMQLQTTYFRDQVAKIDGNYEQNISIGYRVLEIRKNHRVNIGVGVTGQYRELPDEDLKTLLAEAFQDYTFKINGALSITQNLSFQYAPDESSRAQYMSSGSWATRDATTYKVKFYAGLQGKITPSMSLNLRFEYEYDNAILDPDARTDERIIGTVGYAF